MSTNPKATDAAIDSVLRATERTLRRSHEVLDAADETLASDGPWLAQVDDLLGSPPAGPPAAGAPGVR